PGTIIHAQTAPSTRRATLELHGSTAAEDGAAEMPSARAIAPQDLEPQVAARPEVEREEDAAGHVALVGEVEHLDGEAHGHPAHGAPRQPPPAARADGGYRLEAEVEVGADGVTEDQLPARPAVEVPRPGAQDRLEVEAYVASEAKPHLGEPI